VLEELGNGYQVKESPSLGSEFRGSSSYRRRHFGVKSPGDRTTIPEQALQQKKDRKCYPPDVREAPIRAKQPYFLYILDKTIALILFYVIVMTLQQGCGKKCKKTHWIVRFF
jgi:hypothetical protein